MAKSGSAAVAEVEKVAAARWDASDETGDEGGDGGGEAGAAVELAMR